MESACSASSCTSVLLLVVLLLLNSLVIECFIVFILKECLIAIHCVDLCSIWVVRCRFFQSPFLASQTMSAEECQECPEGFLAGPATCGSCPFASSERCLVRMRMGILISELLWVYHFARSKMSLGAITDYSARPKNDRPANVLIFEDFSLIVLHLL